MILLSAHLVAFLTSSLIQKINNLFTNSTKAAAATSNAVETGAVSDLPSFLAITPVPVNLSHAHSAIDLYRATDDGKAVAKSAREAFMESHKDASASDAQGEVNRAIADAFAKLGEAERAVFVERSNEEKSANQKQREADVEARGTEQDDEVTRARWVFYFALETLEKLTRRRGRH